MITTKLRNSRQIFTTHFYLVRPFCPASLTNWLRACISQGGPLFAMSQESACFGLAVLLASSPGAPAEDALAAGFANPPAEARTRAYWWWLNGNVTKAAITRDLEEMKPKASAAAIITDAGGRNRRATPRSRPVPLSSARNGGSCSNSRCRKPAVWAWK